MNSTDQQIAGFRNYKGKEIYHLDISNRRNMKELLEAVNLAREYRETMIEGAGKKDLLVLVDLTNTFVFGEGLDAIKQSGKKLQPVTRRRAVVGLNNAKRILLNSVNLFAKTDFKAFDSVEEAQEWLVK